MRRPTATLAAPDGGADMTIQPGDYLGSDDMQADENHAYPEEVLRNAQAGYPMPLIQHRGVQLHAFNAAHRDMDSGTFQRD